MYSSQEIALRIKETAKSKGISIAQLQQQCGLGKNAINQFAESQDGMKSKNLYAIADFLGVSVDYLLGRTNYPNAIVKTNGYLMKENTIENNSNNGDNIINVNKNNNFGNQSVNSNTLPKNSNEEEDTIDTQVQNLYNLLTKDNKKVVKNFILDLLKE